ncbi:MAG: hypothetical protein AVDCRST_MAG68-4824, partial [uncultured Gemmatimonadetes bacterium]
VAERHLSCARAPNLCITLAARSRGRGPQRIRSRRRRVRSPRWRERM